MGGLVAVLLAWTVPAHAWEPYFPGRDKWRKEIVYFARKPSPTGHVAPGWIAELARSWQMWARVPCASVRARYGGSTDTAPNVDADGADGISVIGFEEHLWRHGEMVTAVTRMRLHAGAIVEADLLLNAVDFEWRTEPVSAPSRRVRELRQTLPHELGHFLGLGHSMDRAAVMHRDSQQTQLSGDDRDGLCSLYPRVSSRAVSRGAQPTSKLGGVLAAGGLVVLGLLLRRLFTRKKSS